MFTSDFQERDIVFGGDKKLDKLIDELEVLFPLSKGTTIESECPVGLIGDDIEAVARKQAKKTGKPVVPVRCEGFRGVSQSLGHHIANDTVRDWVLPKADEYRQTPEGFEPGPYDVNIIGDYNIGGDAWPSRFLLEAIGLRVICQFSGDGTFNEVVMTPLAKMNLIHCYRSMNYICRFMEEKYQIPGWSTTSLAPPKSPSRCAKLRLSLTKPSKRKRKK
jgi:nitrogenase molybdenum-iron protein alpha chain